VLFTDISMPGEMDGLQLVRQVQSEHPHIAFVVTSGHGAPSDGLLPKGSLFLAKPYTAFALMTAIDQTTATLPPRRIHPLLFA
jgi:CheY-like chemotaxis protein